MTSYPACYAPFFSKLDGLVGRGESKKWRARCPVHADDQPSLSIAIGTKGCLIIRCMAGTACPIEKVVAALGLEMDDLFPDNKRFTGRQGDGMSRREVESYGYEDENGVLLFQSVRYDPKSFMQRRPNPDAKRDQPDSRDNPHWVYSMDGVRRVLYRLPQLIAARKEGPKRICLILEGERKVNLAMRAGITATCNPMGAGKWLPEYNRYFEGAVVCVIPDIDPVDPQLGYSPGIKHAQDVCCQLAAVADKVFYLELPGVPPKGSLTEWWPLVQKTDQDRKKDLAALAQAAPIWPKPGAGPGPESHPPVLDGQTTTASPPVSPPSAPVAVASNPSIPIATTAPVPPPAAVNGKHLAPFRDGFKLAFQTAEALRTAQPTPYRSLAEWWGSVRITAGSLERMLENPTDAAVNYTHVREAILLLAASLVLGVTEVDRLVPPVEAAK